MRRRPERDDALKDFLLFADALPPGLRLDGSPSLPQKVIAVHEALTTAEIPHAIRVLAAPPRR